MTPALPEARLLERFRSALGERLGLGFPEARSSDLLDTFKARAQGRDPEEYLSRIEAGARDEIRELASELTVGETFFYRAGGQLDAFRALLQARRGTEQPVRILSAGCASGEEPYTIAMILRDALGVGARDASVVGIDVNPRALERATAARYTSWSLREIPEDAKSRWFSRDGREFVLSDEIRRAVSLVEASLTHDDRELLGPGVHDFVFCRNVIMYFEPHQAERVVARLSRTLAPGGYLFLGYAETLRGLSSDFHLCHTHGAFYYRKKCREETSVPLTGTALNGANGEAAPVLDAGDWVDRIGRAAERIDTLSRMGFENTPEVRREPPFDPRASLALMNEERFSQALALLRAEPAGSRIDPERLLLECVLLVQEGKLGEAEESGRRLLALDELDGLAHYALALCHAGQGRPEQALYHHRVSAYLTPDFSMPRLQLGLLLRRSGDVEGARRELAEARSLLEREDPSRLLLFGGGFGRTALLSLCAAELDALRGAP